MDINVNEIKRKQEERKKFLIVLYQLMKNPNDFVLLNNVSEKLGISRKYCEEIFRYYRDKNITEICKVLGRGFRIRLTNLGIDRVEEELINKQEQEQKYNLCLFFGIMEQIPDIKL